MREIAMIFICLAGLIVIIFWALGIALAIKSGKGISALFSHRPKHPWLSIPDTIAQYSDDQMSPLD
jgi:hypothetical protein